MSLNPTHSQQNNNYWSIPHIFVKIDNYTKNIFVLASFVALNTIVLKHLVFPLASKCVNISDNHYVKYIRAKDSMRSLVLVVPFANFIVYRQESKENKKLIKEELFEILDPYQLLLVKKDLKRLGVTEQKKIFKQLFPFDLMDREGDEIVKIINIAINAYQNHQSPRFENVLKLFNIGKTNPKEMISADDIESAFDKLNKGQSPFEKFSSYFDEINILDVNRLINSLVKVKNEDWESFDRLFKFIKTHDKNQKTLDILDTLSSMISDGTLKNFDDLSKSVPAGKEILFVEILMQKSPLFTKMDLKEAKIFIETLLDFMKPEMSKEERQSLFIHVINSYNIFIKGISITSENRLACIKNFATLMVHFKGQSESIQNIIQLLSSRHRYHEILKKDALFIKNFIYFFENIKYNVSYHTYDFNVDDFTDLVNAFSVLPQDEIKNFYDLYDLRAYNSGSPDWLPQRRPFLNMIIEASSSDQIKFCFNVLLELKTGYDFNYRFKEIVDLLRDHPQEAKKALEFTKDPKEFIKITHAEIKEKQTSVLEPSKAPVQSFYSQILSFLVKDHPIDYYILSLVKDLQTLSLGEREFILSILSRINKDSKMILGLIFNFSKSLQGLESDARLRCLEKLFKLHEINQQFDFFQVSISAFNEIPCSQKEELMDLLLLNFSAFLQTHGTTEGLLRLIQTFKDRLNVIQQAMELIGNIVPRLDYHPFLESFVNILKDLPQNEFPEFCECIEACKANKVFSLESIVQVAHFLQKIPADERKQVVQCLLNFDITRAIIMEELLEGLSWSKTPLKALQNALEFPGIKQHQDKPRLVALISILLPLEPKEFIMQFGKGPHLEEICRFFTGTCMREKRQTVLETALAAANAGMIPADINGIKKIYNYWLNIAGFEYTLCKISKKYDRLLTHPRREEILEIAEFFHDEVVISVLRGQDQEIGSAFFERFPNLHPKQNPPLVSQEKILQIPLEVCDQFLSMNDLFSFSKVNNEFRKKFLPHYFKSLNEQVNFFKVELPLLGKDFSPEEEAIFSKNIEDLQGISSWCKNYPELIENLDFETVEREINAQKVFLLGIMNRLTADDRLAIIKKIPFNIPLMRDGIVKTVFVCDNYKFLKFNFLNQQLTDGYFHYSVLKKSKNYELIKIASDQIKNEVIAIAKFFDDEDVLMGLMKHKIMKEESLSITDEEYLTNYIPQFLKEAHFLSGLFKTSNKSLSGFLHMLEKYVTKKNQPGQKLNLIELRKLVRKCKLTMLNYANAVNGVDKLKKFSNEHPNLLNGIFFVAQKYEQYHKVS